MTPAVKLMDLTESLDMVPEESGAWLNRETGQVVIIDDSLLQAVEETDEGMEPTVESDWLEDQLPHAIAITDGDPRYLALPDKFDFNEYRQMERFIDTVADAAHADQLWRAIKGKGAFRYFKDTAHRLGLIDEWYRYRDDAMNRFMLAWAEAHGVTVDQTPRRIEPL